MFYTGVNPSIGNRGRRSLDIDIFQKPACYDPRKLGRVCLWLFSKLICACLQTHFASRGKKAREIKKYKCCIFKLRLPNAKSERIGACGRQMFFICTCFCRLIRKLYCCGDRRPQNHGTLCWTPMLHLSVLTPQLHYPLPLPRQCSGCPMCTPVGRSWQCQLAPCHLPRQRRPPPTRAPSVPGTRCAESSHD